MLKLSQSPKICQILQKSQFLSGSKSKEKVSSPLYVKFAQFCSRKHKFECLSSIAENETNFKKSEIVGQKHIFEVLYLLNNALKYIYPTSYINLKIWAEMVP